MASLPLGPAGVNYIQINLDGCAGSPDRSSLLEAFPAKHRAPLCGLERDGCLFAALRANRLGFHTLYASHAAARPLCAVGFARPAPLGLVLEALIGVKHLLAGGEDELCPAIPALQDLIVVFHGPLHDRIRVGPAAAQFAPKAHNDRLDKLLAATCAVTQI